MIVVLFLLLVVSVAAAAVGLWSIALVDLVALVIVAVGLRVAFPARRATLTYREIKERQVEEEPVVTEPDPAPVEEVILEAA